MENTGPQLWRGAGSCTFQKHYSQIAWLSQNEAWLQVPALLKLTVQQPTRYIFKQEPEPSNEKLCNSSKLLSKILSKNLHLIVNQGFLCLHAILICVYMCGFLERPHSVQRLKRGVCQRKLEHHSFKGWWNFFLWIILGNQSFSEPPLVSIKLGTVWRQTLFPRRNPRNPEDQLPHSSCGCRSLTFPGFPTTACRTSLLMQPLRSRQQVSEVSTQDADSWICFGLLDVGIFHCKAVTLHNNCFFSETHYFIQLPKKDQN